MVEFNVGFTKHKPRCRYCHQKILAHEQRVKFAGYDYSKSYHIKCFVNQHHEACLEVGRFADELVLEKRENGKQITGSMVDPAGG